MLNWRRLMPCPAPATAGTTAEEKARCRFVETLGLISLIFNDFQVSCAEM
jgi:hypothetical protein